ncbi:PorT family protein [Flavihumibacter rivuli]|uniref:outer membrane beta-barrel protein n=1 Tax=Flavihumibacter rivuli TaxID=2838156 RepID=UPI001BDE4725|nr:outer membrane beta-barrel protein [Flavihumibacter rivuli]ULQ57347.1 PorT family protein [Flavihumibacter rivuli]
MPGHDFEKAVQERSRELRIEPSPAVWEAVSHQLEQKRRRRGLGWLFFGMVLLLGTGGVWWWMNGNKTVDGQISLGQGIQGALGKSLNEAKKGTGVSVAPVGAETPSLESGTARSSSPTIKVNPLLQGSNAIPAKAQSNNTGRSPLLVKSQAVAKAAQDEKENTRTNTSLHDVPDLSSVSSTTGEQDLGRGVEGQQAYRQPGKKGSGAAPVQVLTGTGKGDQLASGANPPIPGHNQYNGSLPNSQKGLVIGQVNDRPSGETRNAEAWDKDYSIAIGLPTAAVEAKIDKGGMKEMSSYLNEPASKQNDKKATSSKWQPSIRLAIGGTALQEGVLEQYSSMANEYLNPAFVPGVLAGIQRRPSEVKVGPSIQLGAGLERKLGKKTGIAVGIQYAYVSNKISIGNKVDSSLLLFNQRQQQVMVANAYYGAGDNGKDHYNRYHFIQLPVDFYWNFDRKQRWSWSTGFSLGYLVGADALQYNYQGGIYYNDNSNLKKFQAGIQTAVTYKLFDSKGLNLAVGPTGQYILTSMDKSNVHKHFLFIGLGAKLNWNRK